MAALFLANGVAFGQYSPDFDTFDGGFTLSGQDGWDTNDGNQPDYVGQMPGYSDTVTDYRAVLGGAVVATGFDPSVQTVDLWRPFTLPGSGNNASFSATMAISSSQTPHLARDSFQWKFRSSLGQDIVTFDMVSLDAETIRFD